MTWRGLWSSAVRRFGGPQFWGACVAFGVVGYVTVADAQTGPDDLVQDQIVGAHGCRLDGVFVLRRELGMPTKTVVHYLATDVRVASDDATNKPAAQAFRYSLGSAERVFLQVELELRPAPGKLACLQATYPGADYRTVPVTEVNADFVPDIPGAIRTSPGNETPFDLGALRKWIGVEYEAVNIRDVLKRFSTLPSSGLTGTVRWHVAPRADGTPARWLQTPLRLPDPEANALWKVVLEQL